MLLRVETNALTHPCWFGALKPTLSNSVETNALTHQFLFQKLVISVKEYTKMKKLGPFWFENHPPKVPHKRFASRNKALQDPSATRLPRHMKQKQRQGCCRSLAKEPPHELFAGAAKVFVSQACLVKCLQRDQDFALVFFGAATKSVAKPAASGSLKQEQG